MLYSSWPPMGVTDNPIVECLYVIEWEDGSSGPPPGSDVMITETGDTMIAENGDRMITG